MQILKYTTHIFLVAVIAVSAFGVAPPQALAASFNDDPQDRDTLRVKNPHGTVNNNNWGSSTTGEAGDTISFAIYYHNTSGETAQNVRVRLSPESTGVDDRHTFTGRVWADNASTVSGSVTVTISGSDESMEFDPGSVIWRPDQTISGSRTLPFGQNGDEIFDSNGLRLGDIEPGWDHQGSVVLNFVIDDDNNNTGDDRPDVRTRSAQNIDRDSADLRCEVNPNGSDTDVWFEYGLSDNNLNGDTSREDIGDDNNFEDFEDRIHNLDRDERYYFRCVAENGGGREYGSVLSFQTDDNGSGDEPRVQTLPARNVEDTSAEVRGEVDMQGEDGEYWFQWGTTPSNLHNQTNHRFIDSNSDERVESTLFGLSNNTQYYYRVVAESDEGIDIGNVLVFRTGGISGNTKPEAVTNVATGVGQHSARLNGLGVNLNNRSTDGWFEWGRTRSLGNTTSRIDLGSVNTNTFWQTLSGLSANTTYYFRAVVENNNGTDRGNILNFRTNSAPTPQPPTPQPQPKVRDADIVKSLENLDSSNGSDTRVEALRGETVRYTIEARNTGDFTLTDTEIKDRIPHFLEFANAKQQVSYDDPQREVVWFIGDLRPGESRRVTLDVIVTDDAPLGNTITNVARIESEKLTRNSNEVDIRVTDRIGGGIGSGTNTSANVFFSGGFFPDTLLGWLLLLILILIFLLIARALYRNYLDAKMAREARQNV